MRINRWVATGLVCLALVVVLGFIKFMQIRAAIAFGESFPEPSETVEITSVQFTDWQPRISLVGEARATREVELRTEVEGIVAQIGFASGAEVSAGDILLQLDISEEKARLAAIEPEIELARQNVERIKGLSNKSAISRQQADGFTSQLAVARAQAISVREIIANKTVRAPFDGVAGLHDFEIGEYLSPNTLVTRLVGDLDKLWVDFSVPQRHAALAAGATLEVSAPDLTQQTFSAEVIAVEPNISSSSRTLRARATLDNAEGLIKPGALVRVSAPVGEARNMVLLASTAVRVDTLGAFVFVLNKDSEDQWRANRRPVTVLAKEGPNSIIAEGLTTGDVVATIGSFKLREGILVYAADQPGEER